MWNYKESQHLRDTQREVGSVFLRIHLQSREVRRINISEIGMEHRAMKCEIVWSGQLE